MSLQGLQEYYRQLLSEEKSFIDSNDEENLAIVQDKINRTGQAILKTQQMQPKSEPQEQREGTQRDLSTLDMNFKGKIDEEQIPVVAGLQPQPMSMAPITTLEAPDYKKIKEQLYQDLPSVLNVPKDQINLEESLGAGARFLLGFGDQASTAATLKKDYEDVRFVDIGGKLRPMVRDAQKTNNKFIFVDEIGFSPKDFLDLSGAATEITPEVIGSFYMAGPRATYMGIKSLANLGPLTRSALGAGGGRTTGSLLRDGVASGFLETDKNLNKALLESFLEGGEAAAWDVGFGTVLKVGTSGFKVNKSADKAQQTIQQAIKDVEDKYGVILPKTPGVLSDTMEGIQKETDVIARYPEGVVSFLAGRAERARDILYGISSKILGKPKGNYSDDFADWAQNYQKSYKKLLEDVKATDPVIAAQMETIINNRVQNLGFANNLTLEDVGSSLRSDISNVTEEILSESNSFYKTWINTAKAAGVNPNPKELNKRLISKINSLNLPKDLKGQVIDVFKPSSVKKIETQASRLTKRTEPSVILDEFGNPIPPKEQFEANVSELSLEQIDEWRKDIYGFYSQLKRKNPNQARKVKQIYDEFDKIIDDLSAKGGDEVLAARQRAKDFFKENVLTTKNPSIEKALQRKIDDSGFKLDDRNLVNTFYRGKEAVSNIRDVKNLLKNNPEAVQKLKDGYIRYLTDTATRLDGSIDFGKLKNLSYDKGVAKELLGTEGAKKIEELNKLIQFQKNQSVNMADFNDLMAASGKEVQEVLERVRSNSLKRTAADSFLKNKLLRRVAEGKGIDFTTPQEFLGALKQMTAKEAREVVEKLPPELGQSLRQEFIADIYEQAGREAFAGQSVQKTSRALGRESIWDVETMAKNLSNKQWRERASAIVGPKTIQEIETVNNAMRAYMKKNLSKSEVEINALGSGGGVAAYATGLLGYIYNRLFSAAHASETFAKVFSKTKDTNKAFQLLLPTMLGTKEGVDALIIEADKDPRFADWLMENAPQVLK